MMSFPLVFPLPMRRSLVLACETSFFRRDRQSPFAILAGLAVLASLEVLLS